MNDNYEDRLGTDPMFPLIMRMAIPSFAAQIINLLYSLVDRIFIGHIPGIGTQALAGVGVTNSVILLIAAFSQIVGGGGTPLASISLGRGDRTRAEKILGNGFSMLLFFTILIIIFLYTFMTPILRVTGASDQTLPYALSYLRIYILGTLFVQISIGLNAFISSQGRPTIAMCSVLIGAILNMILDPIFIFIFNMGVSGAALATVLSQFVSAIWIFSFLTGKRASLRIKLSRMKPDPKIILSIMSLGISPFVMTSTESLIGFVLNGRLVIFGDIYVSALTIMQSAMQILSVPLNGFGQGVLPIISYNYGHGNKIRIIQGFKIMLAIIFTFNFVLTILMILFPSLIASLFTTDTELIQVVHDILPVFMAGMSIFGLQRTCQNMFVALGQAKISLFIALLRKVVLLIPLAIILSNIFGVIGVYISESIADACAAIICTLLFIRVFPKVLSQITWPH